MTAIQKATTDLMMPWKAKTPGEANEAKLRMMRRVPWEGVAIPIPAILTLLPWAVDNDETIDQIVGGILTAESLETPRAESQTINAKSVVGQIITVHDFGMRPGDKDGGWKCYASCDITESEGGEHKVLNTGAAGILIFLARAFLDGLLPITVVVEEVETSNKAHSNPIYFRELKAF